MFLLLYYCIIVLLPLLPLLLLLLSLLLLSDGAESFLVLLCIANRFNAFGTILALAAAGLCTSTLTPFASHFVGPPATSAGAIGLWHQRPASSSHSKSSGGKSSQKAQPR